MVFYGLCPFLGGSSRKKRDAGHPVGVLSPQSMILTDGAITTHQNLEERFEENYIVSSKNDGEISSFFFPPFVFILFCKSYSILYFYLISFFSPKGQLSSCLELAV